MTVLGELKAHYPEILNLMPDEFDSHQFILMLAHKHQPEYVRALYACQDVKDRAPFREVHKQISQSLRDYVEYVREDYSDDIFRVRQANAVWRKRK
jgi:hypothetical protein